MALAKFAETPEAKHGGNPIQSVSVSTVDSGIEITRDYS